MLFLGIVSSSSPVVVYCFNFAFWSNNSYKILVENSHIKGYHIYCVCPHKDILRQVQKEEDNSYNSNSMIVKVPPLKDIPFSFHKEIIGKAKGKEPAQFIRLQVNLLVVFLLTLERYSEKQKIVC